MKKKKEIVFFLSESISLRNLNRLGYYILKKHFKVKIIDLTFLLNIKINNEKNIRKNEFFIKPYSWGELKNQIRKKSFFIDLTTITSLKYILFQRYLIKNGSKKIHITSTFLPKDIFFNRKEKLYFLIKDLRFLTLFIRLIFFIKYRVLKKLNVNPNYAVISGNLQKKIFPPSTKIINSQSLDYNRFLESKIKKQKVKKNYNVFIDQMMFVHPDLKIQNIKDEEEKQLVYLNDLKIFLINLRNFDNKEIIFVFHPRANDKYKKLIKKKINLNFCKFSEWKKTDILIKNSNLVICHTSSATQLAILFYKPIIFLTHKIFSDYFKKYILGLSHEIGLKPINFELNDFDLNKIKKSKKVNKKIYNKYIYNYISIRRSKSNSWNDVVKLLQSIN